MVLFRDSLPIKNVKVENILKGDYMRLSLILRSTKVLIKCGYAPYDDIPALDGELSQYILTTLSTQDIFVITTF